MFVSQLVGRTWREAPGEATHPAHQLVLRAGLARPLSTGGYILLPLGMRVLRRIEDLIHSELTRIGAQELRLPLFQTPPAAPADAPSVAAPRPIKTIDALADLLRREITSYRQLPIAVYQIQTGYNDQVRPRGGLLHLRETTLMQGLVCASDTEAHHRAQAQMAAAIERIITRCGLQSIWVDAACRIASAAVAAQAWMVRMTTGDTTLVVCPTGDYAATLDVATHATLPLVEPFDPSLVPPIEPVATPDCTTIANLARYLNIPETATARAVFFDSPERGLLLVIIRGDREVNEARLRMIAGLSTLTPASVAQIAATGAVAGYASPIGLRDVTVIADTSVVHAGPLVVGANRPGYHIRNVLYGRDWQAALVADIALVHAGDPCPRCQTPLRYEQGIELGSSEHRLEWPAPPPTCLDQQGSARPILASYYQLHLERLLAVIVAQHHDQMGIIWPATVAPADVYLISLGKKESVRAASTLLYTELQADGLRVLYDDRDESAGVKFADADLSGLPVRVLVSERLLAAGMVEIKARIGTPIQVERSGVIEAVRQCLTSDSGC